MVEFQFCADWFLSGKHNWTVNVWMSSLMEFTQKWSGSICWIRLSNRIGFGYDLCDTQMRPPLCLLSEKWSASSFRSCFLFSSYLQFDPSFLLVCPCTPVCPPILSVRLSVCRSWEKMITILGSEWVWEPHTSCQLHENHLNDASVHAAAVQLPRCACVSVNQSHQQGKSNESLWSGTPSRLCRALTENQLPAWRSGFSSWGIPFSF